MGKKPWELDSIAFAGNMNFLGVVFSYVSSLSSDPLFSSIVALYTIILLYFPRIFLGVAFSPVLILTGILLLTLLRLGAVQRIDKELGSNSVQSEESGPREEDRKWIECQPETFPAVETVFGPNPSFVDSFVEWNMRAPLEVIYEEYEGEENDDVSNEKEKEMHRVGLQRWPTSLSLCYPETDSDSSSDGEFPGIDRWDTLESIYFMWDEQDREELIEITLDDGKRASNFHVEEENLIEIDISRARNGELSGEARNGAFRRESDSVTTID